jgi:hypothetical protein
MASKGRKQDGDSESRILNLRPGVSTVARRTLRKLSNLEGRLGVIVLGHRRYVGGRWESIGTLQFDFLVRDGLQPSDVLLDIGCGALRGGIHFISFLDPSHYLGADKELALIRRGIRRELGPVLVREKSPLFLVSDRFEFSRFSTDLRPNYALAQSVFTHLCETDIKRCLKELRDFARDGCQFFATFFESVVPKENPPKSHSHLAFRYTREQMETYGADYGFRGYYIGEWGHPKSKMMRYVLL